MATFAGIWEWFIAGKAVAAHPAHGEFRVRPLPKEDIHLFVKDFDNSRVARLVDTSDRMATFGVATTVPLVALLFIALLLPGGYNLLASRRIDLAEVLGIGRPGGARRGNTGHDRHGDAPGRRRQTRDE